MADAEDSRDEDSWLYGDSANLPTLDIKKEPGTSVKNDDGPPGEPLPPGETSIENNENGPDGREPGEVQDDDPQSSEVPAQDNGAPKKEEGEDGGDEEDDEDDSEDDVHVTIGDIRAAPQYPMNIKRGAQLSSGLEKHIKQAGKFSIEEFESIGTINGVPAHDFSIDALDEKPWRKPGADITDYFNYGFSEETWRAYCERQKQLRIHESGVGLGGLGVATRAPALTIVNENSKYGPGGGSTILVGGPPGGGRKVGPPPGGPRRPGVIDVISGRMADLSPPKEIEVMTGEGRRDYGRKGFDMSVPPPGFDAPPPVPLSVTPGYGGGGGGGYGQQQDYSYPEMDAYYQSYEPSQEVHWAGGGGGQVMSSQGWSSRHRDRKSRSIDSKRSKYRSSSREERRDSEPPGSEGHKDEPPHLEQSSKEVERDREQRHKERHRHRSRSRSPERERERERRSKKHKSRSRSPSHRSHKKKKSKKSEREKSKERSD